MRRLTCRETPGRHRQTIAFKPPHTVKPRDKLLWSENRIDAQISGLDCTGLACHTEWSKSQRSIAERLPSIWWRQPLLQSPTFPHRRAKFLLSGRTDEGVSLSVRSGNHQSLAGISLSCTISLASIPTEATQNYDDDEGRTLKDQER